MKKTLACFLLLILCCQLLLSSCTALLPLLEDPTTKVEEEEKKEEENEEQEYPDPDTDKDSAKDTEPPADVPERFKTAYTIDRAKLEAAAAAATAKLYTLYEEGGVQSPTTSSTNYQYTYGANNNWTAGMYPGSYLMAYQLTGDQRYADIVNEMIDTFVYRVDNRVGMDDHDVGFAFVPS